MLFILLVTLDGMDICTRQSRRVVCGKIPLLSTEDLVGTG